MDIDSYVPPEDLPSKATWFITRLVKDKHDGYAPNKPAFTRKDIETAMDEVIVWAVEQHKRQH